MMYPWDHPIAQKIVFKQAMAASAVVAAIKAKTRIEALMEAASALQDQKDEDEVEKMLTDADGYVDEEIEEMVIDVNPESERS